MLSTREGAAAVAEEVAADGGAHGDEAAGEDHPDPGPGAGEDLTWSRMMNKLPAPVPVLPLLRRRRPWMWRKSLLNQPRTMLMKEQWTKAMRPLKSLEPHATEKLPRRNGLLLAVTK